ncbi:hypothetical protein OC835_001615 [Tilletia horrida]|nr:hypothetical protein OC835_001615 [Tilletia horrida]
MASAPADNSNGDSNSAGLASDSTQLRYLPDSVPMYVCAKCGAHLALQDELISKAFSGRDGKAYLFFSVLNARLGAKEDRQLLTGVHTVADLHCEGCGVNIGWTYLKAWESSQRYKEATTTTTTNNDSSTLALCTAAAAAAPAMPKKLPAPLQDLLERKSVPLCLPPGSPCYDPTLSTHIDRFAAASDALRASLHLLNDDVAKAHAIAQAHEDEMTCNLVHCILHRREQVE